MSSNPNTTIHQVAVEASVGINQTLDQLLPVLERNTPVRTGNARRSWDRVGSVDLNAPTINTTVIRNTAEYSGLLDQGRSQQAPNGIVEISIRQVFK